MMDEITMDVEILSISETTPEVRISALYSFIVRRDGPSVLKDADKTRVQSLAAYSSRPELALEQH